jgi:hypothetical protein
MQQIKSRENVRERGEVFTAEREVKAMCDLVGEDISDIEKRVLEPAAGNGNFLAEILQRRIDVVTKNYKNGQRECRYLVALSNIYAVELDEENVIEARQRLKNIMINAVSKSTADYEAAVDALLETNVICGNFLTKSKRAISIYEYVPNYEKQTFDITRYTLHEIKRTARKRQTGINPSGIGKCIDELMRRPFKITKIKPASKPPVNPKLFDTDKPDLFSQEKKSTTATFTDKLEKLKAMAER